MTQRELTEARNWGRYFEDKAKQFGHAPAAADHFNLRTFVITRQHVISLIKASGARRILDSGCGNGTMLEPISRSVEICGLDLSPTMCQLSRTKGYMDVAVASCEAIPYASNTFDAALCAGLLQCLPSANRTVEELWRVLKPAGSLILVTSNAESIARRILKNSDYVQMYRANALINLCASLGFTNMTVTPLFFPFAASFSTAAPSLLTRLVMASFIIKGTKQR